MRAWLPALWLALGACRAGNAPLLALPPPPPGVAVSAPTPAPPLTRAPIAEAEPTEPAATPEPIVAPAPAPSARVLLEPLYSPLGHAALGTEMQTLGRDEELFQWALGGSSDPAHPSNRPGYHPATRVVVDVELLSRAPKGSTKRLLRIARSSGYWPLRACFEDAQRLAMKPERAAKVRLTLGATGRILGARLVGSNPERDYARCVLARLRALDFSPGFTRKLDVEIAVRQWPGHAPVPPRAPRDAAPVRLGIDTAAALEAVTPSLTACYEQALRRDPRLWGRVALRLALATDGTVESAVPVETQFPDPEVTECARRAVIGARLPAAPLRELTLGVRFGQLPAPPPPTAGSPPPEVGSPPAPPAPPPLSPPAPPLPMPPMPEH